MQVGDLIKVRRGIPQAGVPKLFGLVVETGKWVGNKDLAVMWSNDATIHYVNSALVEVIDKTR
ncbi:MAG: hypothetical protein CBB97_00400 [Candidatus Endolissoclinum sp. TMED37]|nr:MAG: hypothetical protein CBB97_00400 [Candidatus Endolissoclinum sp. TMED37]